MTGSPPRPLGVDDIVLCTGTLRGLDVVEAARVASAAGFDGIAVYLHQLSAVAAQWSPRDLRSLFDDLGLAVAELDGRVDWLPGNPPGVRSTPVAEAVELAVTLGARSLSATEWSQRRVGDGPGAEVSIDSARAAFAAFHDLASSAGLLTHIEYTPFSGIADLATALAVTEGCTEGGVLLDVWHHVRGPDGGAHDALPTAAPRVQALQVCDVVAAPADDLLHETMHHRALPGEGAGRCAAIVAALRRGGCVAPLEVEVFSDALDALGPAAAARRALDATRALQDAIATW